jgi:hypothetical protein
VRIEGWSYVIKYGVAKASVSVFYVGCGTN